MRVMIFQANIEAPNKFMDYSFTVKHCNGINPDLYKKVYQGIIPAKDLEEVFMYLNYTKPDGYTGHSLSMSDVVVNMDTNRAYYCDVLGFKEIPWKC